MDVFLVRLIYAIQTNSLFPTSLQFGILHKNAGDYATCDLG